MCPLCALSTLAPIDSATLTAVETRVQLPEQLPSKAEILAPRAAVSRTASCTEDFQARIIHISYGGQPTFSSVRSGITAAVRRGLTVGRQHLPQLTAWTDSLMALSNIVRTANRHRLSDMLLRPRQTSDGRDYL
jgi:hypothetical protein